MTLEDWQQEILEEIRADSRRSARFFLITFVSRSNGRNRKPRKPREISLIFDAALNVFHTLNEDWYRGADESEYHLSGNELISQLLRYGMA